MVVCQRRKKTAFKQRWLGEIGRDKRKLQYPRQGKSVIYFVHDTEKHNAQMFDPNVPATIRKLLQQFTNKDCNNLSIMTIRGCGVRYNNCHLYILHFQVFEGNVDAYSVKHSYLDSPIVARFIKFHTVHWNRHPSMRVEIIGCQGKCSGK